MDKKINKNIFPLILVILDGWGIDKPNRGNAITLAKTPTLDGLIKAYPNTTLHAHGKFVGLPDGQNGNSEAGHLNIGGGRVVEQDAVIINQSIKEGTFFKNPAFLEAIKNAKINNARLHLLGMISNGMSAHSDPEHLRALINLARIHKVKEVCLHLITDGRDSPKYESLKLIHDIEGGLKNGEQIATIMGRFYAMDRTKKWERTLKAYDALTKGIGLQAESAGAAITESYNRGESDEFIKPYIIRRNGKTTPRISDSDSVIFFNLRSDRARQLTKLFVQANFNEQNKAMIDRKKFLKHLHFAVMTDFGPDLDSILSAYPSVDLKSTLPMQLMGLKQLYIAETEKYAHITYFFNGGYANPVAGEDRLIIPSPDVMSYDLTPVMSSEALTKAVVNNIAVKNFPSVKSQRLTDGSDKKYLYDFTALNYAAPDMIGHTGNLKAGIKCCTEIDKYLKLLIAAYLKTNGTVLITADHGNIENMINLETGEIDTEHSINPAPFILVNRTLRGRVKLRQGGSLCDIAPTILELLKLSQPKEMTGKSLIV